MLSFQNAGLHYQVAVLYRFQGDTAWRPARLEAGPDGAFAFFSPDLSVSLCIGPDTADEAPYELSFTASADAQVRLELAL